MPNRKFNDVVEWYDKLSSNYAELYGEEQVRKTTLALELVKDQEIDLGVDVACGTGILFERLSGRCKYVVGLDLSRKMLETAKALRVQNGDLVRADCSSLPLREKVADYSFAISLVEANSGGKRQVSELARIIKPKGGLVFTVFHSQAGAMELELLGLENARYRGEISRIETLLLL